MILYGASLSPFVRKVGAILGEKGLDFEHKPVAPGADDPEFKQCSPFGKIPGFRDGDYCLADSSAITHYLEAKHPGTAMIPADAEARGKVLWFEEVADTVLVPPMGAIFWNRVVARLMGTEPDEAAAVNAEENTLPPVLAYLESQLADGRDYLVGDSLTLADIAVASPFKNLEYGRANIDWGAYPKLRAFVDRILARDSFARMLEADMAMIGAVA
ncbi:glutathione S-transferase family protein [Parasphingopyxis marina]|uniref:glutathione transferase n=1 Tax=Parasphingopyxis marina TaxID=2761622 RepID=A0A842HZP1_9SPHN|nr:glutathione S-transferase family protein [Parasphingopyxis marina]MBC2778345.1 glutathione S-transferase family protein [Parasphingopyxis marina]